MKRSQNVFDVPLPKRIALEIAFLIVALLSIVFMVLGIVWGMLCLVGGIVFGHDMNHAAKPLQDVADVARMIGKHFKYIWQLDFLPWKRERAKKRAVAQAAKLHQSSHTSRAGIIDDVEFDAVDVVTFFACLPYLFTLAVFIPHAILATITVVSLWGYHQHFGVAELRKEPVPQVEQVYAPTVADKQEADYGPWHNRGEVFERVGQKDFLNIALLSDTGTIKYSQRQVGDPTGFTVMPTSEKVVNAHLTENGQVAFKDQHGHAFIVNPGQTFLFENYKSYAFMFNAGGQLMAVTTPALVTQEVK